MRALRTIGVVLLCGVGLLLLAAFAARLTDGPVAMLPGGPLVAGELVEEAPIDWSFAAEVQEIELESGGSSRTTWLVVKDGRAYVPCSLGFSPFKSWHRDALTDGSAVVRIEGRRYPRTLQKVEDPALHREIFDLVQQKYEGGISSAPDAMWFFHLAPPG